MRIRRHTAPSVRLGDAWKAFRSKIAGAGDLKLFLIVFGVFFLTGYIVAVTVVFPAPFLVAETTIPDVLGLSQGDAVEALQEAGFQIGDVESMSHASAQPGSVIWQDPPAGTVLESGAQVMLAVSGGPQLVPVPDLANYPEDIAQRIVTAVGLNPVVDSVETAAPRGTVVNTRPATGATLRPGSTVRIVVSVGAPTVVVPDLSGMTLDVARDTLESIGLTMGEFLRGTSRREQPGAIYQQDPAAGTLAAPGTRVNGRVVREQQP